jgi:hypothetical protein
MPESAEIKLLWRYLSRGAKALPSAVTSPSAHVAKND